ncbi:LamG domain-containing protein, partial [Nanoarchaeota archaeon]
VTNWYLNGTSIMVLNMPFEATGGENESSWAKDYSNSSNHGTVTSATWNSTGGQDGFGAYEFNGLSHYIHLKSTSIVSDYSDISVELWFKADSTDGENFMYSEDGTGGPKFLLRVNAGDLQFGIHRSSSWNFATGTNTIQTGVWYHAVAVLSSADGMTLYLNASVEATNGNALPQDDTIVSVEIGAFNASGSFGGYFNGTIDVVRAYNRSLTPEQVQLLYQNRTDMISFNETDVGDVWMACVTPNDGVEDGVENCSNTLTVLDIPNTKPIVSDVVLNSTYATNYTAENLTVYFNASDVDGDNVTNITNWYLNGTSIMVLNMPFEATGGNESSWTKDYSNSSNHGNVTSATWDSTGGQNGFGAYNFSAKTDVIDIDNIGGATISVSMRYYFTATSGSWNTLLCYDGGTYHALLIEDSTNLIGFYNNAFYSSGYALTPGTWYHIVLIKDGTNSKLYIDGDLKQDSDSSFSNAAYPLSRIGNYGASVNQGSLGMIDEVIVYNRAITPEQVQLLYENRTDMISWNETEGGDEWQACVTPNDGTEDGDENCSNTLTVVELNIPPTVYNVVLNTSGGLNTTEDDLTVWYDTYDANGDVVKNITNWYIDGTSIMMLNMPFEANNESNESSWTKDYTNYSNHGTVNDATWLETGGYDGRGAYNFDGINDNINMGNVASVTGTQITVMAWLKLDSYVHAARIVDKSYTSCDEPFSQYTLRMGEDIDGNNKLTFEFSNATDHRSKVISSGTMELDTWYHVAGTFNGTHKAVFINGNLENSTVTTGSIPSFATDLLIGAHAECGYARFNGTIDEVKIFDRALTETQIDAFYQNETDIIYSTDLQEWENWTSCITPNDGYQVSLPESTMVALVASDPD